MVKHVVLSHTSGVRLPYRSPGSIVSSHATPVDIALDTGSGRPRKSDRICPRRILVNTLDFQSKKEGSIPSGGTRYNLVTESNQMSLPDLTVSSHETALLITLVARFVSPDPNLTDEENAIIHSARWIYQEALGEVRAGLDNPPDLL